jgi:hypothetical protein
VNLRDDKCYKVIPAQTVTFAEALQFCADLEAFVVRPRTKGEVFGLNDLVNAYYPEIVPEWEAGLPTGVWLGYIRRPLPDGPLEERKNKQIYYDVYETCPRVQMPDIWRNSPIADQVQPSDQQESDETCVAKRKIGWKEGANQIQGYYNNGADDFECTDLHYTICEQCVEFFERRDAGSPH